MLYWPRALNLKLLPAPNRLSLSRAGGGKAVLSNTVKMRKVASQMDSDSRRMLETVKSKYEATRARHEELHRMLAAQAREISVMSEVLATCDRDFFGEHMLAEFPIDPFMARRDELYERHALMTRAPQIVAIRSAVAGVQREFGSETAFFTLISSHQANIPALARRDPPFREPTGANLFPDSVITQRTATCQRVLAFNETVDVVGEAENPAIKCLRDPDLRQAVIQASPESAVFFEMGEDIASFVECPQSRRRRHRLTTHWYGGDLQRAEYMALNAGIPLQEFYCGTPVRLPSGLPVGALVLTGSDSGFAMSAEQKQRLEAIAEELGASISSELGEP